MTPVSGLQILRLDANTDFHRRAPDVIHAAPHDHEITEMDGLAEIDPINRRGHARAARVANCADGGSRIHHREDDPAENKAEVVGVLRKHELRCFVLRLTNRSRRD